MHKNAEILRVKAMSDLMTTEEVAAYLRIKERKIYALVREQRIPCSRATGKLLFPRQAIDLWLAQNTFFEGPRLAPPPPIAAGSHDPLLDWALRESDSELAFLTGGSTDGLQRIAAGRAVIAGLHMIDDATGTYNIPFVRAMSGLSDVVLIEWAQREQGLVLPAGNPKGVQTLKDAAARRLRVAQRQEGAGAQILLHHLLKQQGIGVAELNLAPLPALTETALAEAVLDGKADCGIAIKGVARRFRLAFIPLHRERFDLVMRRRDYFEPPVQKLLAFARRPAFAVYAKELGGYDVANTGRVVFNA